MKKIEQENLEEKESTKKYREELDKLNNNCDKKIKSSKLVIKIGLAMMILSGAGFTVHSTNQFKTEEKEDNNDHLYMAYYSLLCVMGGSLSYSSYKLLQENKKIKEMVNNQIEYTDSVSKMYKKTDEYLANGENEKAGEYLNKELDRIAGIQKKYTK